MNTRLSLLIGLIITSISVQGQGIVFSGEPSWEQALIKAKTEKKFIFVDCFATWCSPCKQMDKDVFSTKSVGDFFNDHFISIKLQFDTTNHDSQLVRDWYVTAEKFKKDYKIIGYPTYLFFDSSGMIVIKEIGMISANIFLAKAKSALSPKGQYLTMLEEYRLGNNDNNLVIKLMLEACRQQDWKTAYTLHDKFVSSGVDLYQKENLLAMCASISRMKSSGIKVLMQNPDAINTILEDEGRAQAIIKVWARDSIYKTILKDRNGPKKWNLVSKRLENLVPSFAKEVLLELKINDAKVNKRWDEFAKLKMDYYDRYADAFSHNEKWFMNNDLWEIFKVCTNKKTLQRAALWSKKTIYIYNPDEADPEAIDTYANLLYKSGDISEAIYWERKALSIHTARQDQIKIGKYTETIRKMETGIATWSLD